MNESKMFSVNWTNIKGAIVSSILMGIVVILTDVIATKNIFSVNWEVVTNAGILAAFTGFISIIKNFLTDKYGSFFGTIQVK